MKKSLLLPAMMLMSGVLNDQYAINERQNIKQKPNTTNKANIKKCKSCSMFPCKAYQRPLYLACDKYVKKHKN